MYLPVGDASRRTCRFGRDGITTSTPALLVPATAPSSPVKSTTASAAFFDVLDLFSVWPVRLSPSQKQPLWSRVHFRHFGSSTTGLTLHAPAAIALLNNCISIQSQHIVRATYLARHRSKP